MSQKILVIDDQPTIVKLVKARLKAKGYEVVTARDGQEGIEMVHKEKPDLVITDLAMPKMTGNIVVRILKRSKEYQHIPIIMLTAFVTNPDMKNAVEVPADVYIAKPFDAENLLEQVEALLKKGKTQNE